MRVGDIVMWSGLGEVDSVVGLVIATGTNLVGETVCEVRWVDSIDSVMFHNVRNLRVVAPSGVQSTPGRGSIDS